MDLFVPYMPNQDEKQTAMFTYVLQGFTGFIGPLIIYYRNRDSRFVKFHVFQACILQGCMAFLIILMWFAWVVYIVWIVVNIALEILTPHAAIRPFLVGFGIVMFVFYSLWILSLPLVVYCAVKANNGEWFELPVVGRRVRRWTGIAPLSSANTHPGSSQQHPS